MVKKRNNAPSKKKENDSLTLQDQLNEGVWAKLKEKKQSLEAEETKQKEEQLRKQREERKQREKNKSFEELLSESSMNWKEYK